MFGLCQHGLMNWSELWTNFLNGDSSAVTAIATLATFAVATVAASLVLLQVKAASDLSIEAAQPNVVASMDLNPNQPQMVEMVFKDRKSVV